jgi:hypothetical protein
MLRIVRRVTLAIALSLLLIGAGQASAQTVIVYPRSVSYYAPPVVSYYAPPVVTAPTVSYYTAPTVSYYAAPTVTYYPAPVVSYSPPVVSYSVPAVSYYAPAGVVTTTRYGPLGRPRVTTSYYYP